jgi:hypothetical protein
MARESQGTDGWATILWIVWKEGENERRESLCRHHREDVFKQYPASAHGQGRSADPCSMCQAPPRRPTPAPWPRASTTALGGPKVAPPRGYGARGSRQRISPIRHGASPPPGSGQK